MVSTVERASSWGVVEQAPGNDTDRERKIKNTLVPLALDAIDRSWSFSDKPGPSANRSSFVVLIDRDEQGREYIRITEDKKKELEGHNKVWKLFGIRIDKAENREDLEVIDFGRKAFLYFAYDRDAKGTELFTENQRKVDDNSLDSVEKHLRAIKGAIVRKDFVVNRQNSPELFTPPVSDHQG